MRCYVNRLRLIIVIIFCFSSIVLSENISSEPAGSTTVDIFSNDNIQFSPDSAAHAARNGVTVLDNGRIIQTSVDLPDLSDKVRILAHVSIMPIPKDDLSVNDKWDRAGSFRLVSEGRPDLEIVKFMTAYGGGTDWTVDVSHLAPVLRGSVTIAAFIDTWVSPAWLVGFSLEYSIDSTLPEYHWVTPLFFENSFDLEHYADTSVVLTANIEGGTQRVMLYYLVSGHCTDGRGADEFVKKDNVIAVDNAVVYRYQPWRDDCRRFREINPYTKRWSDGYWSSDYSRSGWCPEDLVAPLILDLSDHLAPGSHGIGFRIESMRPKDDKGNFGYWRVSAYLVGMTDQRQD